MRGASHSLISTPVEIRVREGRPSRPAMFVRVAHYLWIGTKLRGTAGRFATSKILNLDHYLDHCRSRKSLPATHPAASGDRITVIAALSSALSAAGIGFLKVRSIS